MRRTAVPLVAILAVAALVGLLVYGVASKSEDTTIQDAVASGERPPAPVAELPVLGDDGATGSLADYRGEVVILNFWASWCAPCEAEAPELERAQRRLEREGAGTVLGVTYHDASRDALEFIDEHGLTYPSLRDVEGDLTKEYGTRALPETFVIDADGRIVDLMKGTVTREFLDQAIDRAVAR
ncbi:MAG TPA: TlpA disulfide reductase family protein [Capillimicrobium sp.]